jgi:hypothetical protein
MHENHPPPHPVRWPTAKQITPRCGPEGTRTTKNHPAIRYLWKSVHGLENEQLKYF